MTDAFHLQRFVDAQSPVYRRVMEELRTGRKRTHWMWFVFPQVAGLGSSSMAQEYAIASRAEAAAYASHPVLGARLRECTKLIVDLKDRTAEDIFGYIDAMKLRSSMTLFMTAVPNEPLFAEAIAKYFQGKSDDRTLQILEREC